MSWHSIDGNQRSAAILDEQPSPRALTQPWWSTLHRHAVSLESDKERSSPVATAAAVRPAASARTVPATPKSRGVQLVPWRLLWAPSAACWRRAVSECCFERLKEQAARQRVKRFASGFHGENCREALLLPVARARRDRRRAAVGMFLRLIRHGGKCGHNLGQTVWQEYGEAR